MAPPIPGLRRPAPPRRSAADVLAGALAMVALAVLTAGVPAALITLFGLPIPHHLALSALTKRLDLGGILAVLAGVLWLAWLQLLWCVIAEIRAAVRNAGVPAKVPLAGGTQAVVHRLVTAVLLLFTATAAITPALLHSGPAAPAPATVSITHQAAAPDQHAQPGQATRAAAGRHRAEKIYVVQPPVGRYHESLWEIAQNHLGNGRRYQEIYELNKDHVQPDGSKLTIASLIRPGWVLHMPHDAQGPGIETVTREAARAAEHGEHQAQVRRDHSTQAEPAGASAGSLAQGRDGEHRHGVSEQPGAVREQLNGRGEQLTGRGEQLTGRGEQLSGRGEQPGDGRALAGRAALGVSGAALPGYGGHQQRHGTGGAGAASRPAGPGLSYPDELAAATLVAAGLLTALGRRRREQLWQRGFGRRVAVPQPAAAAAEAAIRLGAGDESARLLDSGLRHLCSLLASQDRQPPNVYAARLADEHLDVSIAPADQRPPWPWTAVNAGRCWRLPRSATAGLNLDGAASVGAPFPGLVSIGTDEDGRVLVDLEAANGLIAVNGSPQLVRAVLAAMAMELATNRWSDQMEITLVGFGAELAMIAPDRVRAVASLDEVLPSLEARAAEAAAAAAAAGTDWVLTGRMRGSRPGPWAPHYLIMAVPPAPAERDRLLALAASRHRTGAGYLVAGDVPGAVWSWEVTEDGRLHAGLLGFDVTAQLLPPEQYAAVADLFAAAADTGGTAVGLPPTDAAPAAQLLPGALMPVEVCLLGPASVQAPGAIEPDRAALAAEIVVYLAAHPGGVHLNVLTGAVWPRGVAAEVRDAALARVRDWLGYDPAGQPHLAADADGRLRLGPQVRVDWQVFRALVAHAGLQPRGSDAEAGYLERALREVRSHLLDGRDSRRYVWLATDELEYEVAALVADAAHRLSDLRRNSDPVAAMAAARAGLRLATGDEMLWRDLLLAADATGDVATLHAVVAEISARAALDDVLPAMAPETESLIDELLPSWRTSVA